MGRGKKEQVRDLIIGRKFRRLKDMMGSYAKVLDDPRWMEIVNIYDEKTLQRYVNKGVPLNKVAAVEEYIKSKCNENESFARFIEDTPEDVKIKGAREKYDQFELPGNPGAVAALTNFVHVIVYRISSNNGKRCRQR